MGFFVPLEVLPREIWIVFRMESNSCDSCATHYIYNRCFTPSQPRRVISGWNKNALLPQVKFWFTLYHRFHCWGSERFWKNEVEWIRKAETSWLDAPSAGAAHKALFWPTTGLERRKAFDIPGLPPGWSFISASAVPYRGHPLYNCKLLMQLSPKTTFHI